ncbi:MAG: alpha/beta hydrolase [Cyclobacteriaceae bacterium]|nr:alpha/beta hydrolase [Cyclobacteriaceae bacterium]
MRNKTFPILTMSTFLNQSGLAALIVLIFVVFSKCNSETKGNHESKNETELDADKEYFITADDKATHLYIREAGRGNPVIVLHGGFGNDHTNVIDVASGLHDQFRFIFYDQRGSSLSYCKREDISVQNHVKDLETIRKALDLEKFTLVSHSAGTVLALLYLEKYPRHVENLILLGAMEPKNGSADFFTEKERATWDSARVQRERFSSRPEIEEEINKAGLNIVNRNPWQRQLYNHIKYYAAQNIYHIEKWKELSLPHWNQIAAQAASESFDWKYNFVSLLAESDIPITVINGEYDLVVGAIGSPVWQHVIENDAQNVTLSIIEKAGHLSWIDTPTDFREIFKYALDRTKKFETK